MMGRYVGKTKRRSTTDGKRFTKSVHQFFDFLFGAIGSLDDFLPAFSAGSSLPHAMAPIMKTVTSKPKIISSKSASNFSLFRSF